jgi:hypothetical protein
LITVNSNSITTNPNFPEGLPTVLLLELVLCNDFIAGHICNIGQGEAQLTKYVGLKLGGGQAYGRSND